MTYKLNKQPIPTLFARQEIYDTKGSVCAYELLYRDSSMHAANIDASDERAGDNATSFVLSHLFTDLDIDKIIGSYPAYINFTRNHLLRKVPALLPNKRIIIELLEHVFIDELLLKNIKALTGQGYRLALDDFVFRDELIPLVEIADVIKIEVLGLNEQDIRQQLEPLSQFKGKLLAEKIEDRAQLMLCKQLGFDFFQGYYLNYPNLIHGQKISESKTLLLKLFSELYDPEIDIERIEEIILQIPKLSYRILRLANSAALYQGKKIDSLLEAIRQIGLVQIRNWISILLVSSIDDVSNEMLERTLIRAKMGQILAEFSGLANPHQAFTVGILSTLDTILNEPFDSLLSKIPLSEDLNQALLTRSGELGYLLTMTQAYEQANFNQLEFSKFSAQEFSEAYLQGIEYANSVLEILCDS